MWQRSKGNTSSFAPYIHLLPTVHHGVPIFFNGEALEMLQYPPLVEQVVKKKAVQSPCFTGTKVQGLTLVSPAEAAGPLFSVLFSTDLNRSDEK